MGKLSVRSQLQWESGMRVNEGGTLNMLDLLEFLRVRGVPEEAIAVDGRAKGESKRNTRWFGAWCFF